MMYTVKQSQRLHKYPEVVSKVYSRLLRNLNIQIPLVRSVPSYKAQDLKVLSHIFSTDIPGVGLIYTCCIAPGCWYIHFGH